LRPQDEATELPRGTQGHREAAPERPKPLAGLSPTPLAGLCVFKSELLMQQSRALRLRWSAWEPEFAPNRHGGREEDDLEGAVRKGSQGRRTIGRSERDVNESPIIRCVNDRRCVGIDSEPRKSSQEAPRSTAQ